MKKILNLIFILVLAMLNLTSCSCATEDDVGASNKVTMVAEILEIKDTILVNVKESDIAFGNYILIVNNDTSYLSKEGNKISKSDLNVGDIIIVQYGGQVMLSQPPQIVAKVITAQ